MPVNWYLLIIKVSFDVSVAILQDVAQHLVCHKVIERSFIIWSTKYHMDYFKLKRAGCHLPKYFSSLTNFFDYPHCYYHSWYTVMIVINVYSKCLFRTTNNNTLSFKLCAFPTAYLLSWLINSYSLPFAVILINISCDVNHLLTTGSLNVTSLQFLFAGSNINEKLVVTALLLYWYYIPCTRV